MLANGLLPAAVGVAITRAFDYGWTAALFAGVVFLSSSILLVFAMVSATGIQRSRAGRLLKGVVVFEDLGASVLAFLLFQTLDPMSGSTALGVDLFSSPRAWRRSRIRGRRILYVDDEALMRSAVARVLRGAGAVCLGAGTHDQAIVLLELEFPSTWRFWTSRCPMATRAACCGACAGGGHSCRWWERAGWIGAPSSRRRGSTASCGSPGRSTT